MSSLAIHIMQRQHWGRIQSILICRSQLQGHANRAIHCMDDACVFFALTVYVFEDIEEINPDSFEIKISVHFPEVLRRSPWRHKNVMCSVTLGSRM